MDFGFRRFLFPPREASFLPRQWTQAANRSGCLLNNTKTQHSRRRRSPSQRERVGGLGPLRRAMQAWLLSLHRHFRTATDDLERRRRRRSTSLPPPRCASDSQAPTRRAPPAPPPPDPLLPPPLDPIPLRPPRFPHLLPLRLAPPPPRPPSTLDLARLVLVRTPRRPRCLVPPPFHNSAAAFKGDSIVRHLHSRHLPFFGPLERIGAPSGPR